LPNVEYAWMSGPVVRAGEVDGERRALHRHLAVDVDVLLPVRVVIDVDVGRVDAVGQRDTSSRKRRFANAMMLRTAARTVSTPKRSQISFKRSTPSCAAPTCARRSPRNVGRPVVRRDHVLDVAPISPRS
jgi:hypothetical protein